MAARSHQTMTDNYYVAEDNVKVIKKQGTSVCKVQFQVGVMSGKVGEDMPFYSASFFVKDKETAKKMAKILRKAKIVALTSELAHVKDTIFHNVMKWDVVVWRDDAPKKGKGKKKGKK